MHEARSDVLNGIHTVGTESRSGAFEEIRSEAPREEHGDLGEVGNQRTDSTGRRGPEVSYELSHREKLKADESRRILAAVIRGADITEV